MGAARQGTAEDGRSIDAWREMVVGRLLVVAAGLGVVGIAAVLIFSAGKPGGWWRFAFFSFIWAGVGGAALWRNGDTRARAWVFTAATMLAGVGGMVDAGLPVGRPLLVGLLVIATVLIGWRAGVICLVASLAGIALAGWLHVSGRTAEQGFSEPSGWVRAGVSFTVIGSIVVLALASVMRQFARSLAEAEARLDDVQRQTRLVEGIVANSRAAIFVKDRGGRYVLVNQQFQDVAGVAPEAVIGKRDADISIAAAAARLLATDARSLEDEGPIATHEAIQRGGSQRTYLAVKFPIVDARGDAFAVGGIATDVSEIQRGKDALRERNAVLRAASIAARTLLETDRWEHCIDDIVAELGRATGVSRVTVASISSPDEPSRVLMARAQWSRAGVSNWMDELAPEPVDIEAVGLGPFVASLETGHLFELRRDDLPPGPRQIADRFGIASGIAVPILVERVLWGFFGFEEHERERDWTGLHDVLAAAAGSLGAAIARHKLSAELERRVGERTVELEEANRELQGFSQTVSHDLRAPLRHVRAYAQLLRDEAGGALDDNARGHLNVIMSSIAHMSELIDGLLTFSRLGRAALELQRVELAPLVRAAIAEQRAAVGDRTVRWEVSELPAVIADATLLGQVVANLVDNAVKYTRHREQARIEVGARLRGRVVELFVRDNGVGFDMKYADKLFSMFQRLHTDTEFEGSGIGLALVRRIVERLGGRCWALSAPGEGATFYASLPAAEDRAPARPPASPRGL